MAVPARSSRTAPDQRPERSGGPDGRSPPPGRSRRASAAPALPGRERTYGETMTDVRKGSDSAATTGPAPDAPPGELGLDALGARGGQAPSPGGLLRRRAP